jgi:benzoate transport
MVTSNAPNTSLANTLEDKSMTSFQWRAIGLCCLINMLDGFDLMVMGFTAASVSMDWSLNSTQLGYLLSAGLVGMTVGSFFIAPWADRIGRRPLILLCVALAGLGMVLSGYANTPMHLGLLRFLTGLGIGGIIASSYVIAGEYASNRWRSLAISLQGTAVATGASLGGFITAKIIALIGWKSVFFYGGVVTLGTLPILYIWLPESLDFYVSRKPHGALEKVNAILRKLGVPQLATLPTAATTGEKANLWHSLSYLFSRNVRYVTMLIWAAFFLIMFGYYFVMSWSPRLLVAAGLTNQQGITGGVMLSLGGIAGTLLIGLVAARVSLYKVHSIYLIVTAMLMILLLRLIGDLNQTLALAFMLGVFVHGCLSGAYAMTPMVYESAHRVTGLGWAIGVGRLGSILAPLAAGPLLDAKWRPDQIYSLYAATFVLAAIVVLLLHFAIKRKRTESGQPKFAYAN